MSTEVSFRYINNVKESKINILTLRDLAGRNDAIILKIEWVSPSYNVRVYLVRYKLV